MPRRLLLATKKGLFHAEEKRGRWQVGDPEFRGVPVATVLPDARTGAIYAGLDHGHFGSKLHVRRGRTWEEVAVPVYPQAPEGVVEKDGSGRPWPRSLRLLWTLEADPRSDDALWCGTIPGALFHSPDGGRSWRFVDALWDQPARGKWFGGGYDQPGIHSVLVDPRDARRVTVGISCGGVWRTDDGGASWRNMALGMRADYMPKGQQGDVDIQDPHRLAMCTAEPDRLWCQHHNGIFVTKKGGETWREVKAKAVSRFGFACAAHPTDPDVAWFVPAEKDMCRVPVDGKVVVLRTDDGGKTFRTLTRGLPQQRAYDLVYRHGLDVTSDGETLAMGSTTGNVWIGEGGGARWQRLDANLPPVLAVRWMR
jgi:photosystem II stability/assembly factor-like uncharacterized protein